MDRRASARRYAADVAEAVNHPNLKDSIHIEVKMRPGSGAREVPVPVEVPIAR
jgi:hypothetical protein